MGFRSKWIAVPAALKAKALEAAKLVASGKTVRLLETGWYGLQVGGRYVVIGSGWDYMDRMSEGQARALSSAGEAYFWAADDTTMCSRMSAHRDGALVWAFTHTEETPVELEGAVPDEVRGIVVRQQERQKEAGGEYSVDYVYDAAHLAGLELLGFRHDAVDAPAGTSFEVLRAVDAPPPVVQRNGPLALHLEASRDGTSAELEARESIEVSRILVLSFEDGELSGVSEHAGRALAAGERISLWCPEGEWELQVTLVDGRAFQFRPSSGFSLSGLFNRLLGRR